MTGTKNVLPSALLSRKEEITAGFIAMAETHIADLMTGRATKRFHAYDFGERLFINPRHLTTTLKVTMNSSVCDYMEGRIIEEAQRLLRESDLSVAETGLRFAYSEPTNFTKFFKGMTGLTPLQYRRQFRG